MALICKNAARECTGCGACFNEPKIVAYCTKCKEPIYTGDNCLILGEKHYCELCLQEMTTYELLELLGYCLEAV